MPRVSAGESSEARTLEAAPTGALAISIPPESVVSNQSSSTTLGGPSVTNGSIAPVPWKPYREAFHTVAHTEYPGAGTEEDPFIVDWMDEDAENPMNWPSLYRWLMTLLVSVATLSVGFCSTAYAGSAGFITEDFGVSSEIVTLGISLFVLGFALGPLIWAPLSEVLGRRPLLIWTFAAVTAFNAAGAVAPTMTALAILRFFAGAIGSSPLTNAGGIIADMFQAEQRGLAMSLFAAAPFMGPVIGPIVGGFAGEALGWRWVFWLMTMFTGALTVVALALMPETYAPVLLRRRVAAVAKAKTTGLGSGTSAGTGSGSSALSSRSGSGREGGQQGPAGAASVAPVQTA